MRKTAFVTVISLGYTSGLMVPVERAFFVAAVVDRWHGELDYLAFNNRSAANAVARELQSTVVDWPVVMAEGARRAQVARATAD